MGQGPFFGRVSASASTLHTKVEKLVEETLPEPATWNQRDAQALKEDGQLSPATNTNTAADRPKRFVTRRRVRGLEIPKKRWDIALHTAAGGLIGAPEPYVHDVGLRLDFRITKSMSVGAYIAYINTPSRAGRGGNIYGYLQFENRLRFSALNGMSIPLRIGVGLLPFNGPLIRFAAGLNFPLSDSFEFGVDIFNPTVYFHPNRTLLTFTIGLELIYRF